MAGDEVEHFDGLAELSNASESVVVGTVISAKPGRELRDGNEQEGFVTLQFLELTIQVEDNLGLSAGNTYAVEFGPYPSSDLAGAWSESLVGDEAVFVLRRKGSANPAVGATGDPEEYALNKYRLVSSQGLLLNDGGDVATPLAMERGFPNGLDGSRFEEVVDRVDELNE